MPTCFTFNYFYSTFLLASRKYREPPCLCSRAGTLLPTTENTGRVERQSGQRLGKAKDPLGHRACTSAPSAPGHPGEEPKHPHADHQLPSCAGWQLTRSSPRAPASTLGFRRKKRIPPAIKRSLFTGAGSWIIILCSALLFCSSPLLFSVNENTPEELSIFFQNVSISLIRSNLHHNSFLVSNCATALYLCPRTNALVEDMNWNLIVEGTNRHPRD